MSEGYIRTHFAEIMGYANVIESRMEDDCTMERVLRENARFLEQARTHKVHYLLIEDKYEEDLTEIFHLCGIQKQEGR